MVNADTLRHNWVLQGPRPNCGSCCIASIVNYARAVRADGQMARMHNGYVIGLAVDGIPGLGSVSSQIREWLITNHPGKFEIREVKVDNTRAHWGGLVNRATGGATGRPRVDPYDHDYWTPHPHRFLLREFSAKIVLGHFIIQTGIDDFWDPNFRHREGPASMVETRARHRMLSERADALQIDVLGAVG